MQDILQRLAQVIRQSTLTEAQLAERVGIHRTTLNRYLNEHADMPANILVTLLEILGLRFSDLLGESQQPRVMLRADNPKVIGQPFFIRVSDRFRFYANAIKVLGMNYPEVSLPQWQGLEATNVIEIQEAALETRRILHLPERGPVTGLFTMLSRAIKLLSFQSDQADGCDGFSLSSSDFGIGIAVNRKLAFERCLSTVAHEIGHTVLHPDDFSLPDQAPKTQRSTDPREKAAWAFTGRFLLPTQDLRELYASLVGPKGSYISPDFVVQVKHLYGTSAILVVNRLREEGMIDGAIYGSFKKRLYPDSKDLTYEPQPLGDQAWMAFGSPQSHFENVVARMSRETKITDSRVAELLELSPESAERWVAARYDICGGENQLAS